VNGIPDEKKGKQQESKKTELCGKIDKAQQRNLC